MSQQVEVGAALSVATFILHYVVATPALIHGGNSLRQRWDLLLGDPQVQRSLCRAQQALQELVLAVRQVRAAEMGAEVPHGPVACLVHQGHVHGRHAQACTHIRTFTHSQSQAVSRPTSRFALQIAFVTKTC